MEIENLVSLHQFCEFHEIENTLVLALNEHDLIEIFIVDGESYIHTESIHLLEKIIRLHHDLSINFEGIDVIVQLIDKINSLQEELMEMKKRLEGIDG
ncbi:MAG: chaperone modulator CbpM [Fluviicola sp.]|jgi:hypothetical protein|nr:chaperone modulator CbpM [Fluviicola sp.]